MMELAANSSPPLTTASKASAEASTVSSSGNQMAEDHHHQQQLPPKKKRNQPGMPDPDSEVVALSPKTLMATNRFVCEICGKGFQRDQNLQLHRRGHNLPWKLRQRGTKEVKRRVYVCPETNCIHHDPKRALGDLTGIKKHFCRKHGEKKWKCERCSKKYAVQSDWKAHMKTCGTKEYKCDCGTVFSRRDSFVTHRAFCDALAQETVKAQVNGSSNCTVSAGSPPDAEATAITALSSSVPSPVLSIQSSEAPQTPSAANAQASAIAVNNNNVVFGSVFAPLSGLGQQQQQQQQQTQFSTLIAAMSSNNSDRQPNSFALEPPSLSLSSLYQFTQNNSPSIFHQTDLINNSHQFHQQAPPQPAMSATALLQKAAQMGPTSSASSFLWGFDAGGADYGVVKNEGGGGGGGGGGGDFVGVGPMMSGPSGPTTLDLLGLGIGPSNGSPNGLASLLTPFNDGLDVASFGGGKSWDSPPERK